MSKTRKNIVIKSKHYPLYIGSKSQVWHGTAYKNKSGLTKSDLLYNSKSGRIVSRKKHNIAKRQKHLIRAGYVTKKGVFQLARKTHGGFRNRWRRFNGKLPRKYTGGSNKILPLNPGNI